MWNKGAKNPFYTFTLQMFVSGAAVMIYFQSMSSY